MLLMLEAEKEKSYAWLPLPIPKSGIGLEEMLRLIINIPLA